MDQTLSSFYFKTVFMSSTSHGAILFYTLGLFTEVTDEVSKY